MHRLPARLRIGDTLQAHLMVDHERAFLTDALPEGRVAQTSGMFIIRYGIVLLARSYLSLVPDLVAMDTGGGFAGEEMWDFLFNKSNLFPRADVLGWRDDDKDDMVTVKSLDLMHPLRVFAYTSETAPTPIARVSAWIGTAETLSGRISEHLPIFTSIETFHASQP